MQGPPTVPLERDALLARVNSYAPYTGAEIRVTELDLKAGLVRVEMGLSESNANLVGTQFGGSLYSMVDPHLMILLMSQLGPDFVVWDKSATIEFLRPGTGPVHATIRVTEEEVAELREAAAGEDPVFPSFTLDILNAAGKRVATVTKTLWVKRR